MTERQQAILLAVVEQYAEVASPVGSNLLAKVFDVSSATVRAEMAELERLGYIDQPHTSAGRVPTDKGYRFYVNHLSEQMPSADERRGEKEFMHPGQVQEVARLLDNLEPWLKEAAPNDPLSVYIGRENPIGRGAGCSLIISRFRSPYSDRSYIGVLGPTRQSYRDVTALVARAGRALEDALYV
jgi:heat-inducible transcriptional repressor